MKQIVINNMKDINKLGFYASTRIFLVGGSLSNHETIPASGEVDICMKGPNDVMYSMVTFSFFATVDGYRFVPKGEMDWTHGVMRGWDESGITQGLIQIILDEVVASFKSLSLHGKPKINILDYLNFPKTSEDFSIFVPHTTAQKTNKKPNPSKSKIIKDELKQTT